MYKALVTGGAGLLGTNMTKRLASQGIEVLSSYHNKIPEKIPGVSYAKTDLTNLEECRAIMNGIDVVIHFAAYTFGANKMQNSPESFILPNVVMHVNTLDSAYKAGVKKFILIGSTTSYPDTKDEPATEDLILQGDPYSKYYIVGWIKRWSEILGKMYTEHVPKKMDIVTLRAANVYGPHDKFDLEGAHVLPSLINKVVRRDDPLEVWGDGNDVRDLLYVDDFIDAVMLAIDKGKSGDDFNIGSGVGVSVKQMLDTICSIEDYYPKIVYNADKPTMIPKRFVNVDKAKKTLGFESSTSLEEGIKKTIDWYKGI